MGIIHKAVTLERGLRSEFEDTVSTLAPDPVLEKLFLGVPSDTDSEKYGWLGAVPAMRQWVDERHVKDVIESEYTLQNVAFESTIGVDRFDLKNDKVGAAFKRTRMLTERGLEHYQKLLIDNIIANGNSYDGVAYFATTHSEGSSGSQSNLLTGTGTSITQLETDLETAISAFTAYKDSEGQPIRHGTTGTMDLVVLCPPALLGKFRKLAAAEILSNTTNVLMGTFDFASSARFSDANDWYIFEVARVKPFIKQENQPLEFDALEAGSDVGFFRRTYVYGVSLYGNAGYGWWQAGIKTTNT